jgi:hypothetical protein
MSWGMGEARGSQSRRLPRKRIGPGGLESGLATRTTRRLDSCMMTCAADAQHMRRPNRQTGESWQRWFGAPGAREPGRVDRHELWSVARTGRRHLPKTSSTIISNLGL